IFLLLVPDVRANHRLVQSYCRYEVAPRPEHLPSEVPRSTSESTRNGDGALPLQIAHYARDRVLRRNADAHVHVIWHQVSLHNLTTPLLRQLTKHLTKVAS